MARALDGTGGHPHRTEPAGWPLAPVLAHGDFTAGQVLLDGPDRRGSSTSTPSASRAALDVGSFLAYLHVTHPPIRTAWPALADMTALFLEAYSDACPAYGKGTAAGARRSFLERTTAYHALALGRIGASACRQLKDDRLAAVMDVLDSGNAWTRSVAG